MNRTVETAVILAGVPVTLNGLQIGNYPKPLLPIANLPLLEYQTSILFMAGVRHILLCLSPDCNIGSWVIKKLLSIFPVEVETFVQPTARGTGGTLDDVRHLIRGTTFLVMGGDLFTNVDLQRMFAFHVQHGLSGTVAAVKMEEPAWSMERIEIDQVLRVKTIHRIHPAYSRRSKLRPVGIYVLNRSVLDIIPDEGYFDLKEQLFKELFKREMPVRTWEIVEYCRTITNFDDYFRANMDILLNRVGFAGLGSPSNIDASGRTCLSPEGSSRALYVPPIALASKAQVWNNSAVIGPAVIGNGCVLEERSVVNNSILVKNVKVGRNAQLTNCVVCEGATIGENEHLHGAVVMNGDGGSSEVVTSLQSSAYTVFESKGFLKPFSLKKRLPSYSVIKGTFDAIFSGIVVSVLSPLLLLIAIAIKIDSPGEVIFRQRRCGLGGKEFTMYKFRSMVSNAEDVKREIQSMNEVDGPMFKIARDPRITRVGYILRKTNLDELPQLWNIICGDMSLVGPRPLSHDEMTFNPRWRDMRLSVRPGLTGLWQMYSHMKVTFADWIRYDTDYVEQCSLALDFQILVGTLRNAFKGLWGRKCF